MCAQMEFKALELQELFIACLSQLNFNMLYAIEFKNIFLWGLGTHVIKL